MSVPTEPSPSPFPQDVESTRATLSQLANELLELSKTFEPKQQDQLFTLEPPIITKARAFVSAAQSPMEHSWSLTNTVMGASIIRTLMHLKALEEIPHPDGATAKTVAKATGSQTSLIERLLRAAVSIGFLTFEPQTSTFKHTALSATWTEPKSVASDWFSFCFDTALTPMILLPDWLAHNDPNQACEPVGDEARTFNPLTYRYGSEGTTVFETLAQQPERLSVFARILGGAARLKPFTGIYPWERLADPDPERTLFVDIGSGPGHAIGAILAAYPNLPAPGFVLQDLPAVVAAAEKEGSLPAGVRFQAQDFFKPNGILGAKVYHIRACLHDWPDGVCVEILKCVVSSMAADSRLLIVECLIPEDPKEDEGGLMGFQDMIMLCIGGKERSREGFERIAGEAGLVVETVWEGEKIGRFVVIECRLA